MIGRTNRTRRGMTLIEVMVAVLILAIAITASLETFTIHVRGSLLSEQRRLAYQFAQAKLDEMRWYIATNFQTGGTLDGVFQQYGPLDFKSNPTWDNTQPPPAQKGTGAFTYLATGGYVRFASPPTTPDPCDPCNFVVGDDVYNNSNAVLGTNIAFGAVPMVYYLDQITGRPLGTVTILTDEDPKERNYGNLLGQATNTSSTNWYQRNPFGVDINGDRQFDFTATGANPAAILPFPLDLNGNGNTTDTNVYFGFKFVPVVVTVQWTGPIGPERVDVFSVLTSETP